MKLLKFLDQHRVKGVVIVLVGASVLFSQQQQSGGAGTNVSATQSGTWTVQPGNTANTTPWLATIAQGGNSATVSAGGALKVDGSATTQPVSGTLSVNALPAGTNLVGYTVNIPAGCAGTGTSFVRHDIVGVATSAGTSVSATTGCVIEAYVNNITNSAVTIRLQDKTGTPIIWMGGNGDYSVPPNSNLGLPIQGIIMTAGMTAIAGTGAALNLHITTRE